VATYKQLLVLSVVGLLQLRILSNGSAENRT